jgi:hypothetical protein
MILYKQNIRRVPWCRSQSELQKCHHVNAGSHESWAVGKHRAIWHHAAANWLESHPRSDAFRKACQFCTPCFCQPKEPLQPPIYLSSRKNTSISMPNPNLVYHVSNLFFYYATCVEINQPAKINISQGAYWVLTLPSFLFWESVDTAVFFCFLRKCWHRRLERRKRTPPQRTPTDGQKGLLYHVSLGDRTSAGV